MRGFKKEMRRYEIIEKELPEVFGLMGYNCPVESYGKIIVEKYLTRLIKDYERLDRYLKGELFLSPFKLYESIIKSVKKLYRLYPLYKDFRNIRGFTFEHLDIGELESYYRYIKRFMKLYDPKDPDVLTDNMLETVRAEIIDFVHYFLNLRFDSKSTILAIDENAIKTIAAIESNLIDFMFTNYKDGKKLYNFLTSNEVRKTYDLINDIR